MFSLLVIYIKSAYTMIVFNKKKRFFVKNTLSEANVMADVMIYDAGKIDGGLIGKIALYYLLFSGIFVVSGYFTFEKADLK